MSLRVAFDLDGTVADMAAAMRREAEKLFGSDGPAAARTPAPGPDPVPDAVEPAIDPLHLSAQQRAQLWDRVSRIEDFWTTLSELEVGIIARIAETSRARQWEVLFITARPPTAGETAQRQTQRWLHEHGFAWPSVYIVPRSRGRLAAALELDAVVDDRVENCMDVALDSQAQALLVQPGAEREAPAGARSLGVQAVTSASEAVTLLERMDDAQSPGLVRSLRRMLRRGSGT